MKESFPSETIPPVKTVVGIGVFDGIHLAHRRLLSQVTVLAKEMNLTPGVLTFDPPPPIFFNRKNYLLITTLEEKVGLFYKLKLDFVFVLNFTEEVRSLSPIEFAEQVLVHKLKAKVVVVGENFTFGRNREGDVNLLQNLGSKLGFQVFAIPLLRLSTGEVVSSSLVRKLLQEGKIREANKLLCSPFSLKFRRGNFPNTFILKEEGKVIPPFGPYLVHLNPGGTIRQIQFKNQLTFNDLEGEEVTISFLEDQF